MTTNTINFVSSDNPRSLFPLSSTVRYIELGEKELSELVFNNIFDDKNKSSSFTICPVVYALKDNKHLRRMLFLDPVANFYVYDFLIRNNSLFQVDSNRLKRKHYGYKLKNKKPINPFKQYHAFRKRKYELKSKYAYFAKLDISNCFNNFYHHEVVSHLRSKLPEKEAIQFGQFLREINSGVSINCFPQGIYPAKAIGNNYLTFSEKSLELKSSSIIRFLDDFFIFDDSISIVEQDIITLQQIIGGRGLYLNESKTKIGSKESDFEEKELDSIKISLLEKREAYFGYDEDSEENVVLEPEEIEYLNAILQSKDVSEEDVELALCLFKEDQNEAEALIDIVFNKYPHLIKNLHRHMKDIKDDGKLWEEIKSKVSNEFLTEYELFWLARSIIDVYELDEESVGLLLKIFSHSCATPIVQAAVLELSDNNFGLDDLKLNKLQSGVEGIVASSAVAGLEKLEKSKRNQKFKYLSKSSNYLSTLCSIISKT
ncbi:MAG: hypothetical protein N838_27660 [Thiohalocapsa sp. PB-PSB1]|nr:MAG: hypothetical protein N838_27660 [Thiohalocapsa sp. PB-PSB1]